MSDQIYEDDDNYHGPRLILQFDAVEHQYEARCAMFGPKLASAVAHVRRICHDAIKYGDNEKVSAFAQQIMEETFESSVLIGD